MSNNIKLEQFASQEIQASNFLSVGAPQPGSMYYYGTNTPISYTFQPLPSVPQIEYEWDAATNTIRIPNKLSVDELLKEDMSRELRAEIEKILAQRGIPVAYECSTNIRYEDNYQIITINIPGKDKRSTIPVTLRDRNIGRFCIEFLPGKEHWVRAELPLFFDFAKTVVGYGSDTIILTIPRKKNYDIPPDPCDIKLNG